jgi:GrpB-like predicted nucleotidyltransferase (UPF0157 family)
MRELEVVDYQLEWSAAFQEEAERLTALFGPLALEIAHVGSTAVPGLAAKPTIDLQLCVARLEPRAAYAALLARLDYLPFDSGENDVRIVFYKDVPRRYNLHIMRHGSWTAVRHILFRDALRADPELLAEYAALKRELAGRRDVRLAYHEQIPTYTMSKTDFIEAAIERAAATARIAYRPGNADF